MASHSTALVALLKLGKDQGVELVHVDADPHEPHAGACKEGETPGHVLVGTTLARVRSGRGTEPDDGQGRDHPGGQEEQGCAEYGGHLCCLFAIIRATI